MQDLAAATYLTLAIAVIGGYLLGSIPFGLIATRLGGAGDIRKIGSGNIGATNVLRSGRKDLAAITLLGDAGKGVLAVLLARFLTHGNPTVIALAGGSAFLGHLFPVWLKFNGGKGVATFYGVLLSAAWPVGVAAAVTWLAMAFLFRISSLAALTAAVLAAPFALAFDQPYPMLWLCLFMALLIFIRHRPNIIRLLRGEEPRIGQKKDAATPPVTDAP
ncbi:glycerol-3-phosphate 1-O-acyltransferase PlsY [uncultured Caulobacter sp.]|uniref:glycerol-3-phosphate 1-O-acyltransferase PlsY n=1 Tax=uncultured Caulobacter sp. TaxID=158749 RepID=UPI00260CFA68|nr:glycerol-3-phosphate 1-O-acyltransferase PlsY [uncultured Caulobacter sp.]